MSFLVHACNFKFTNFLQDLTFRITPDNYVLRVPASEAVGQFIALSTQGTVTRYRLSVGENSSKSTACMF